MNHILDRPQITNNIVSGIAAGIVVSLALGLYQWVSAYYERQDQIQYVSEVAAVAIEKINTECDDKARLLYYNRLLRSIESFLNAHEASFRIRYSEKEVLRTAFPYSLDGTVKYYAHVDRLPTDADAFFDLATEQLTRIPWLILKR